ncbi:ArnT family glycosyltransferase [Humisphaera borealis]|uniref:Glycosyltransferase RgtA/B/C/D-like domain-containing protein n=1 Tax=Humisphaera borealis TaxID=2807512 RepID=A0A7M2WPG4_9BACT|nr:hypothetical protein [Humisphaera borealis]QOV87356.1 hypothetical protein IPV69_13760 [Humisphaera borealis]
MSDRVLSMADRYRYWLLALTLVLYIAGFNAQWRLEPDSALYLSIGRNLVEGQGYTFHGKDHRLAYPGVPMLFAAIFKVFGTGSLVPHLVVLWLMGLATLALVYRLFFLHAGRPTAVLMTFGVAISRVFYRYTFELLTDLPFLFGVMAFFVGYEAIFHRRSGKTGEESRVAGRAIWLDGVLMLAGLAIAISTRPSMLALVLAAVLSAIWSLVRGKARWGHLVVAALIVAAVAVFYVKDPRSENSAGSVSTSYAEEDQLFNLNVESLVQFARKAGGNAWEVLNGAVVKASFGLQVVPGLNAILSVTVLLAGILLVRTRPLWGMWVLATLAMVLLVPKPLDRYFLPVVPVLVFAWWNFVRWAESRFTAIRGRYVFLLLFGLGGICNILSTVDFVIQNRRLPFLTYYKEGRYASVYDVAKMIESSTPPSGSVGDPKTTWVAVPDKFARILSFLSRRYCIEPDRYSALDPRTQNVFVLTPLRSQQSESDSARQPTEVWLQSRGAGIEPVPIAAVPNKNPDDRRPFTLHDVVPAEALATRPTTTTSPAATNPAPNPQGPR